MTSKEALKLLYSDAENYAYFNETEEDLSEIKAEYELIKQDLERLEKLEKINYIQSLFINEVRKYITQLQEVYNCQADYYNLYIKFSCPNEKDLFDILTTLKLKEEYETIRCSKEVTK